MDVMSAGGDEALVIAALLLLFIGIVLWSQIGSAPTQASKGGRQTATAIFIMASVAVFCLIWGRSLGREARCLPIRSAEIKLRA